MHFYRLIAFQAICLLLSGCYISADSRPESQKRTDASSRCDAMGYLPPYNADYDLCVISERAEAAGEMKVGESSFTSPWLYTRQSETTPQPCGAGCSSQNSAEKSTLMDSGLSNSGGHR